EIDINENEYDLVEETFKYKDNSNVSWINIDGLHNIEIIKKIGSHFGIHTLVLEDVLNTNQQPKIEDHGEYLYITLKMIFYDKDNNLNFEQFSFILFSDTLITFQEKVGDVFEPVRNRIRKKIGKVRIKGVDYLTYALIDSIVDHYYLVSEKIHDQINELENNILEKQDSKLLKEIYALKKELLILSRYIRPSKELINRLENLESLIICDSTKKYIKDLHDHIIDVNDTLNLYREMVSGLIDTYLNLSSNKMNEVMKVLTIMASIFIPLTFIAGIYGMNFNNMPELQKSWGYPVVLFLMGIVAAIMLIYFKIKKWL
ncbi:MAG: magnesium/cobalt transporter CorA, partial [Candidatus Dadabacteria bacterium]|nr:magnesium/cobalt transporter CorA [Candidatus Dadabacteria bacterium]